MDDGEKVDIALSYMRGSNIQDWVQNYIDNNFSEQADNWKVTWAIFKQHPNNSFLDKGRKGPFWHRRNWK